MFFVVLVLGGITLFYIWLKWNYSYWKRKGVPGPEPSFIVGNTATTLTLSEHFGIVAAEWYKKYSNEPYIGYYKMFQPAILLRDPDLIKDILINDFNHFRNNEFQVSKKHDPLTAASPFFSKDEEWQLSRKAISPLFSSSRMKSVLPMINDVAAGFIKYVNSFPANTDFDAKEISTRFSVQNVVRCGFSVDAECFDKDKRSEFMAISQELFIPSLLAGFKFFIMLFVPRWAFEYIPTSFIPEKADKWFRNLVRVNKQSRSKNVQSNDLFETLLQIQEKHNFDDTFLAGQSLSFYLEGTETSATTFSYVLYELARNPECQEKLYDEIVATMAKHDGQLTYDAIQEMSYLDCVLLEASRIDPTVLLMSKVCNKAYTMPKMSQQTEPTIIEPGTVVQIPVLAIHKDPNHYPEPEKFKPERFTEIEQRNRHKAHFLAFGEGPRVCIGMRFAKVQIKVALIHITTNFRVKISPKHKPIVIDPKTLLSFPKDGILLRFDKR